MEIVKVENLSKHYQSGETTVRALNDVSFSINKGEFVAIVGPSGSGKSTLLHMLGGVDEPSSGKVYIDQTDVYDLNETQLSIFRRRQIGLIYQFYNLIPVLTVKENIALPLRLDGHDLDEDKFQRIVSLLNLENRLNHLPNQLSGGQQQQRVSIGRALVSNPSIVLADEPTGNLDSKNSQEIVSLLKLFNRTFKQTLVVITHDESIALQADRIITIEDGQISRDEVIRP
ncbi:ABC transporter ATP-binding protein [Alkalibacterium sp. s-m-22]